MSIFAAIGLDIQKQKNSLSEMKYLLLGIRIAFLLANVVSQSCAHCESTGMTEKEAG